MPLFILGLLFRSILEGVRARLRRARATTSRSLCADCVNAHVQYGANATRAISCTYGGKLRLMKLDVLYCTDYEARNQPVRVKVIGFVRDIVPADTVSS